jgi:hypothetical protein
MLRSLGNILGSVVHATDGEIGKVYDFFFDDRTWTMRYLVVETGDWLRRRRVLISTYALGKPEWQGRRFPVALTQEQGRGSPDVDTDKPVSRQHEIAMNVHYGWPHYWSVEPLPLGPPLAATVTELPESEEAAGDPYLRSLREVSTYRVQSEEDHVGYAGDFIVDDDTWIIRYLVFAIGSHWPRKQVLVGASWVTGIYWASKELRVSLTRSQLAGSPEFDPAAAVNREYEVRLYDYYGRPRYWE